MYSKNKICLILGLLLFAVTFEVYANPAGENVVAGTASFDRSAPNTLTVTSTTNKTIINYDSFSIAAGETTRFKQPSSGSVVLNRVTGVDPSDILGNLSSNGKLFLVNPNGIIFGAGSRVDARALVASTLDITDSDFLNGQYKFFKNGNSAFLKNEGAIAIRKGGYVILLSQAVDNSGSIAIEAGLGSVILATGEKMTLHLDDAGDISVVIDEAVKDRVLDSAIINAGTISAGKVLLTSKVLNNVFDYAINNSGIVQATRLVSQNGSIELVASGAPVNNSGTLKSLKIDIKAPDTSVTNTSTGMIVADGTPTKHNGGSVLIDADTILQQGLISANLYKTGKAGRINLISETLTTLDSGSLTEAKALGVKGNGGRILIISKNGDIIVKDGAVIDVSSGIKSKSVGFVELSAFDQLTFSGTIIGFTPHGHKS